jgi:hypothetical protein
MLNPITVVTPAFHTRIDKGPFPPAVDCRATITLNGGRCAGLESLILQALQARSSPSQAITSTQSVGRLLPNKSVLCPGDRSHIPLPRVHICAFPLGASQAPAYARKLPFTGPEGPAPAS